MIVPTLIAATVAAAQPVPAPQAMAAPAPSAEKKMACCEKMAKGEGCGCCTGKDGDSHQMDGKHDQGGHDH